MGDPAMGALSIRSAGGDAQLMLSGGAVVEHDETANEMAKESAEQLS